MSRDNSFKDYIVKDVFGHIEEITNRAMFIRPNLIPPPNFLISNSRE